MAGSYMKPASTHGRWRRSGEIPWERMHGLRVRCKPDLCFFVSGPPKVHDWEMQV